MFLSKKLSICIGNCININLNSFKIFIFPSSNIQIYSIPFDMTRIFWMLIILVWTISLVFVSPITNYLQSSSKSQQIPFIWPHVPILFLSWTLINIIFNKIKQTWSLTTHSILLKSHLLSSRIIPRLNRISSTQKTFLTLNYDKSMLVHPDTIQKHSSIQIILQLLLIQTKNQFYFAILNI